MAIAMRNKKAARMGGLSIKLTFQGYQQALFNSNRQY